MEGTSGRWLLAWMSILCVEKGKGYSLVCGLGVLRQILTMQAGLQLRILLHQPPSTGIKGLSYHPGS